MAGNPVLIDSCWYIAAMRMGRHPLRDLRPISEVRDIATCGVIRSEVARGIREKGLLEKFQARWDVMLYVPTDNQLWADVEETVWGLDRAGKTLPLADVVIACCARRIGAVVLTFDPHFQMIPGIVAVDRIV